MKLQPGLLRADFTPSTYSEESKTITVVCTTDTPVVRWSWDGQYNEVLSMDKKHVRLERFLSGAPLLNSHNRYELKDVIGVVQKAWIDGSKLMAEVKLSDVTTEEKEFVEKVKSGIIRNLSIGYKIFKVEETKVESGQIPTLKAIDWEPYEVSFVPVPADYLATVRSEQNQDRFNEVEIIKSTPMEDNNKPDPKNDPNELTEAQRAAAEKAKSEGIEIERKRIKDISDCVRSFGLPETFQTEMVEKGHSIDKVRELAQIEFAKNDPNKGANNSTKVTEDEADKERTGIEVALVQRSGNYVGKLSDKETELAKKFRGISLLDLAGRSLRKMGVSVEGMDKMEIAGRSISSSSSDFPVLLEGVNRRVLLASYNATADRWRKFSAIGSVSDFRENKRLRMGSLSVLESVDENGEYRTKKISDADYEKVQVETKGNIINLTRKMIVNDDLAAFTRLGKMLGRASARSIEVDVFALLASNPTLVDGIALFHADHKNLVSNDAGTPTVTRIDAMRQLMAKQTEKDGNDYLDIMPSIFLCGTSLGSTARILNTSQYDPDATNKLQRPNVVAGMFSEVVDTPRISGTEYYMFADPNEEPVIEVSFLDGVQTPHMESQETFNIDGIQWKVRMDYGVDAVGFRGAVKSPGA